MTFWSGLGLILVTIPHWHFTQFSIIKFTPMGWIHDLCILHIITYDDINLPQNTSTSSFYRLVFADTIDLPMFTTTHPVAFMLLYTKYEVYNSQLPKLKSLHHFRRDSVDVQPTLVDSVSSVCIYILPNSQNLLCHVCITYLPIAVTRYIIIDSVCLLSVFALTQIRILVVVGLC